jgi:hypothetical protein
MLMIPPEDFLRIGQTPRGEGAGFLLDDDSALAGGRMCSLGQVGAAE